ncbi:MAG: signal peptidase I [Christensenellaceae bacterium]|jgi:signal peptidase I|nr:signal peptidase I [Christensenellaceae bacterium]
MSQYEATDRFQTDEEAIREERRAQLRENIVFIAQLVMVVAIGLLLRRYVFTLTVVSGSSMQETLQDHQVVAVERLSYLLGEPKPGDIVICHYPGDSTHNYVKRIVAMEGDTIAIRDGKTYLNGSEVFEDFISYPSNYDYLEYETMPLPAGKVFVMGDNRAISKDSRSVGLLSLEEIQGRVVAVVFPFGEIHGIGPEPAYSELS